MEKALQILKEELAVIEFDKMMQSRAKRLREAIAELEEAMKPKSCSTCMHRSILDEALTNSVTNGFCVENGFFTRRGFCCNRFESKEQ